MSRSAGTGSPVWFRCSACRSTLVRNYDSTVELTGRTRPAPSRRYHARGSRSTGTLREYRCSCGHVGWSNHVDLAHRELRERGVTAGSLWTDETRHYVYEVVSPVSLAWDGMAAAKILAAPHVRRGRYNLPLAGDEIRLRHEDFGTRLIPAAGEA